MPHNEWYSRWRKPCYRCNLPPLLTRLCAYHVQNFFREHYPSNHQSGNHERQTATTNRCQYRRTPLTSTSTKNHKLRICLQKTFILIAVSPVWAACGKEQFSTNPARFGTFRSFLAFHLVGMRDDTHLAFRLPCDQWWTPVVQMERNPN